MNASRKLKQGLLALLLSTSMVPLVSGLPSYAVDEGNNCAVCHSTARTDRMQVTPQDLQIDLGTQLDGQVRGPLSSFSAEPGGSVTFSVDILNGSGAWAVQLKQLEKGGQEVSLDNKLVWTFLKAGTWTSYGTTAPYLASNVKSSTGATTMELTLILDPATPPDTYELVFTMAGKSSGLYHQDAHFYLEVASATPFWAGYPIGVDNNVDTTPWLGWIKISDTSDWVWVYNLSKYIYLPELYVSPGGSWSYIPK